MHSLEVFLGSLVSTTSPELPGSYSDLGISSPDLPKPPAYFLEPGHPTPGSPNLLRHSIVQTHISKYRNIDLFPISYGFRPRLRGRLTHRGLPCRWKP